ncbi:MAG: hypothetical protein JXR80_02215 [Deltaproteobacteria bacterium]|nr:hypothetical protein [Deltaproteobacteria bacterium]
MKDKRLLRINCFILALTIALSITALLLDIEQIGFAGVAIGGLLAFFYFLTLSILISRAFAGAGEEGLDGKVAGRLGLKLLLLTFALAIVTIIVILTRLCQPFGFLIGFSALFGSIALETMAYLAFSKPQEEAGTKPADEN